MESPVDSLSALAKFYDAKIQNLFKMQNLLFQKNEINPHVLSCKNFEQESDAEFAKKLQKTDHVPNSDDCYTPPEVYAEVLAWGFALGARSVGARIIRAVEEKWIMAFTFFRLKLHFLKKYFANF